MTSHHDSAPRYRVRSIKTLFAKFDLKKTLSGPSPDLNPTKHWNELKSLRHTRLGLLTSEPNLTNALVAEST